MKKLPPHLEWQTRAVCAGQDTDLFFENSGNQQIKEFCDNCPVRTDCLAYAVNEHIEHGIWGGLTPGQRKGVKGKWGAPGQPIKHGTYNGYRVHRYRGERACEACLVANNQYAAKLKEARRTA